MPSLSNIMEVANGEAACLIVRADGLVASEFQGGGGEAMTIAVVVEGSENAGQLRGGAQVTTLCVLGGGSATQQIRSNRKRRATPVVS